MASRSKLLTVASFFLLVAFVFHCSDKEDVTPKVRILTEFEGEYERIVRTLAHDSLSGRWMAGDGIRKAERIVKKEFERVGLEAPAAFPDFLQPFTLHTLVPTIDEVQLNGQPIAAGNVVIMPRGTADRIELGSNPIEVVRFNTTLDFPTQQYNHIERVEQVTTSHQLVIVPTQFANELNNFRSHVQEGNFFRRLSIKTGPYYLNLGNQVYNIMYILSDAINVSSFTLDFDLNTYTFNNVVGIIPGNSRADEIVIFSAHFDHLGAFSYQEDPIYNGANDNASGTAALIVLAEYFKQKGDNERTLMFIGFNGEEIEKRGSTYFVDNLPAGNIKCVINIDMIANESDYGWGEAFLSGSDRSGLIDILNKNLIETGHTIHPEPFYVDIYERSDNFPFTKKSIVAHTISTFRNADPNYHMPTDDVELINFDDSFLVIEAVAQAATSIISGEDL